MDVNKEDGAAVDVPVQFLQTVAQLDKLEAELAANKVQAIDLETRITALSTDKQRLMGAFMTLNEKAL